MAGFVAGKECAFEGCSTVISTRARANMCIDHKCTALCNCQKCAVRNRSNNSRNGELVRKDSVITLPPAPWD